jgi:WD40 repeat protein
MRAAKQLRGVMAFFEASKASKKQKNKPRAAGVSRHVIHKHLPQQRLSEGPEGTPAHQGRVYAMATGGGIVAAGGVDKALYVHCIGKCQHACQTEGPGDDFPAPGQGPHVVKVEHKSSIFAVALCHDCSSGDTYIAAGGEDKRVSVYHARNGFASLRLPLTLIDFEFKSKESVLSASLRWRTNQHPKAKVLLLAFGGMDSHVRVFDVLGRVLIYSMELPDIIRSVVLHPTKDLLAIAKTSRVLLLEMADVFDAHSEVFTLS